MPSLRFTALSNAACSVIMMCALCCATSIAQKATSRTAGKEAAAQSTPVSLPHLYWHFLIYQHQLDQMAVEQEKQGKDGRWLRSYLQIRLSMTDLEFQPIRESADRMAVAIATVNADAKAIVTTINASRKPDGTLSSEGEKKRTELKELTALREKAILAEIDTLNAALTPEARSSLQSYLTKTFSNSVKFVSSHSNSALAQPFHKPLAPAEVRP